MDSNNWKRTPQPEQPPMDGGGVDWRTQLQPDFRHRIVNEMVQELNEIVMRFEEKIYHAATSQSDYLRRISLKTLTMESKSNSPMPNAMQSNSAGMSRNPQDPASLDSTAQTGNSDWQEEVYQKIKVMRNSYFADVLETYQKVCSKLKQHEYLPQQPKPDEVDKLKLFKEILERTLSFLQISKGNIQPAHKEKLPHLEKQILGVLGSNRPRKPVPF